MPAILRDGLKPMSRQYVHLSARIQEAKMVASRRKGKPICILQIDAKQASQDGILFYREMEDIWLSEPIPPKYFSKM